MAGDYGKDSSLDNDTVTGIPVIDFVGLELHKKDYLSQRGLRKILEKQNQWCKLKNLWFPG